MLKRQGLALLRRFVRLFPGTFNKNIGPDDFSTQKEAAAKSSFCNRPVACSFVDSVVGCLRRLFPKQQLEVIAFTV